MLESSMLVGSSSAGDTTVATTVNLEIEEGGSGGGGSISGGSGEGERVRGEEGDRNSAGNRWPRDETLALLKIRSGMDVAFRDSTLKAPLWDEVSRKLAEIGYNRSAKKCKEKFENIYKYHKRTKEGRSGRQSGKNYRFFEQLEIFDNQPSLPSTTVNNIYQAFTTESTMPVAAKANPIIMAKPITQVSQENVTIPSLTQNPSFELMSTSTSTTSSSGKESKGNGKRRRKLGDYFDRLMKVVLERQENLQNKFMEAIEKCENDRMAREEAWKMQELARVKKEEEFLAHERAVSAAKDAAVIAFLQRISDQPVPVQLPETSTPSKKLINMKEFCIDKNEYMEKCNNENSNQAGSSRWPKAEVEALISLRSNLDLQYNENGPKGPLWEDISSGMKNLGYDRSAKRCKEKWENINKYYKRVKDSNKRRPEDSKTCPYFHSLESLYERKSKKFDSISDNSGGNLKPEDILMQMIGHQQQVPQQSLRETGESENVVQSQEDDGDGDGDGDEDEDEDDDDDDNGDDYQVVVNNTSSVGIME